MTFMLEDGSDISEESTEVSQSSKYNAVDSSEISEAFYNT